MTVTRDVVVCLEVAIPDVTRAILRKVGPPAVLVPSSLVESGTQERGVAS